MFIDLHERRAHRTVRMRVRAGWASFGDLDASTRARGTVALLEDAAQRAARYVASLDERALEADPDAVARLRVAHRESDRRA